MESRSGRGFYPSPKTDILEVALHRGLITQKDKDLIIEYVYEMKAKSQFSVKRETKITSTLLGWRKNKFLLSEYAALTMKEIYSGINRLNTQNNTRGIPYSQNTKHDYVTVLKAFCIWLITNEYNTNLKEKQIHEIKTPNQDTDTTHPDEILSPDDIINMIASCNNSRDRALIAVHYEAGTRIGELARLRWRDILWDEYGARIRIEDHKTKKIRSARLTQAISSRYLAAWRADYPGEPEGDNPVFITKWGDPVMYAGVLRVFKKSAERAGVEKKIQTHIFRKSRGTHLIEQGLPLPNLMQMFWGNLTTRQIKTYIRMSPVEQDRVMLRHAGIITDEESKQQERRITGRICPECHEQNPPTAKYCYRCGIGLDEAARETQNILDKINKDPQVLIDVLQKLLNKEN